MSRITITISDEMHEQLSQLAESYGISISAVAAEAVRTGLMASHDQDHQDRGAETEILRALDDDIQRLLRLVDRLLYIQAATYAYAHRHATAVIADRIAEDGGKALMELRDAVYHRAREAAQTGGGAK